MKASAYAISVAGIFLVNCCTQPAPEGQNTDSVRTPKQKCSLDVQGHRGCRGLMPENTMAAFKAAVHMGVRTLELDVVISADSVVLCSHEPWFSHEIALDPQGNVIPEAEERKHNIYAMTYAEILTYDVGLKPHPRFPNQEKTPAVKPKLAEVIAQCDRLAKELGRALPQYNIETKTQVESDDLYHPSTAAFCTLLMQVIDDSGARERCMIQSFDTRSLHYIEKHYHDMRTVLLVENGLSAASNIEALGFRPYAYSPDYNQLTENDLLWCHDRAIQVIPWTVNDTASMSRLMNMGVDGLISDYPDRVLALCSSKQ